MPRRRTLLLVLAVLNLPLVVIALIFLRSGHQAIDSRIREQQLALARAGAQAAQSFLLGNIATLRSIGVELKDSKVIPPESLQERLTAYMSVNPTWNGMSVVREDMQVISGSQAASRGVSLADRPYLQRLFAENRPTVSDGLVPSVTRTQSVIIAVPIVFTDGSRGAVLASVGVENLGAALRALLAPDAGEPLAVVDSAGQQLVQPAGGVGYGQVEQSAGRPYLARARQGASGIGEFEEAGEIRLVAFTPVEEFGWAVTVSQPASAALEAASDFLQGGAFVVMTAAITVTVAAWLYGQHLRNAYEVMARARSEADEAVRSREQFLGIAAHELRTPLTTVVGATDLLRRRLARAGALTADAATEPIDALATAASRLARLVDDLLDVSRLQSGRFQLNKELVNLKLLVQQALDDASDGRSVEVRVPEDAVELEADPLRLRQVLVNLIGNAVKYSTPEQQVVVEVAVDARRWTRIAVTDGGIGIPTEELGRLFEPFARASNAEGNNIPGLGLGLFLSRQVVEAHGGRLSAASAGVGRGSTFTLTLPPPDISPDVDLLGEEMRGRVDAPAV